MSFDLLKRRVSGMIRLPYCLEEASGTKLGSLEKGITLWFFVNSEKLEKPVGTEGMINPDLQQQGWQYRDRQLLSSEAASQLGTVSSGSCYAYRQQPSQALSQERHCRHRQLHSWEAASITRGWHNFERHPLSWQAATCGRQLLQQEAATWDGLCCHRHLHGHICAR